MQSAIDLWQRIDQRLATHTPRVLEQLNPGTSEADIAEAEATLGFALPEDFKASYRIHNGGGAYLLGLLKGMQGGSLDPLHDVVSRWLSAHEIIDDPPDFVTGLERKRPPVQPVAWPFWVEHGVLTGDQRRAGSDLWVHLSEQEVVRLSGQVPCADFLSIRDLMRRYQCSAEEVWQYVRSGDYLPYRRRAGHRWEWRFCLQNCPRQEQ